MIYLNQHNLAQYHLLLQNNTDLPLSQILPLEDFLITFITHLNELFQESELTFKNLEPIITDIPEANQETTLSLNDIELGELFLIHDSSYLDTSLVYYSPYGLIESTIFRYEDYNNFSISDYVILVKEFSSHLLGEYLMYSQIEKNH